MMQLKESGSKGVARVVLRVRVFERVFLFEEPHCRPKGFLAWVKVMIGLNRFRHGHFGGKLQELAL